MLVVNLAELVALFDGTRFGGAAVHLVLDGTARPCVGVVHRHERVDGVRVVVRLDTRRKNRFAVTAVAEVCLGRGQHVAAVNGLVQEALRVLAVHVDVAVNDVLRFDAIDPRGNLPERNDLVSTFAGDWIDDDRTDDLLAPPADFGFSDGDDVEGMPLLVDFEVLVGDDLVDVILPDQPIEIAVEDAFRRVPELLVGIQLHVFSGNDGILGGHPNIAGDARVVTPLRTPSRPVDRHDGPELATNDLDRTLSRLHAELTSDAARRAVLVDGRRLTERTLREVVSILSRTHTEVPRILGLEIAVPLALFDGRNERRVVRGPKHRAVPDRSQDQRTERERSATKRHERSRTFDNVDGNDAADNADDDHLPHAHDADLSEERASGVGQDQKCEKRTHSERDHRDRSNDPNLARSEKRQRDENRQRQTDSPMHRKILLDFSIKDQILAADIISQNEYMSIHSIGFLRL